MRQSAEKCKLKYLEFFPAAFASVRFYFSTIYNVAKDQAGPLKPGIEDIEEVLRDVLRPVLRAAEDYSRKLLKYIDNKVGEKLKVVDEHVTFFIKPIVFHTGQLITEAGRHTFLILRSLGLDSATSSHGIQYEKEVYANALSTSTFEKCISFCVRCNKL
ncbi:hypothetical protein KP509_26G054700 [Ceratopteris richardii]|uniref:Uncharacterized protein n=1 Tax=Ceratopteris richardii TaxID=49495 RepID=A0A8T2RNU6_CERRI|nr:hypothetical protein KP509_26G054700 [Ceratopteris richardii]